MKLASDTHVSTEEVFALLTSEAFIESANTYIELGDINPSDTLAEFILDPPFYEPFTFTSADRCKFYMYGGVLPCGQRDISLKINNSFFNVSLDNHRNLRITPVDVFLEKQISYFSVKEVDTQDVTHLKIKDAFEIYKMNFNGRSQNAEDFIKSLNFCTFLKTESSTHSHYVKTHEGELLNIRIYHDLYINSSVVKANDSNVKLRTEPSGVSKKFTWVNENVGWVVTENCS